MPRAHWVAFVMLFDHALYRGTETIHHCFWTMETMHRSSSQCTDELFVYILGGQVV